MNNDQRAAELADWVVSQDITKFPPAGLLAIIKNYLTAAQAEGQEDAGEIAKLRAENKRLREVVPIATGWAVVGPHGLLGAPLFSVIASEADAWWHAGFRTSYEIAEAEAHGARAFRCEIREIEE